ncbi:unnamed protein product [Alternaria alternata]
MGFWSSIADAFARDGSVTLICEKLPVIGYVTAGVQLVAGNPDHAKRAAATATNSTLKVGGAAVGFAVGGPLGAVADATVGSMAGLGCLVTSVFTSRQGMFKDQPRLATGDELANPEDKDLVRVITHGQEEVAQELLKPVTYLKTKLAIVLLIVWTRLTADDKRDLSGIYQSIQDGLACIRANCEWEIINRFMNGGKCEQTTKNFSNVWRKTY